MKSFPKIKRLGEKAILIEFEPEISLDTLKKLIAIKKIILENHIKPIVDINNTFHSILICYDIAIDNFYNLFEHLKKQIDEVVITNELPHKTFLLPVCYDEIFALDKIRICKAKNRSFDELINLHFGSEYINYFSGFLPGFLYLGGLPKSLRFPRLSEPRLEVPKGAVGIGGKQTGIYPQKSPGGWNIIGNCPAPLFNPFQDPPSPFCPGNKVKFYEINLKEHREIEQQVKKKQYQFKIQDYGS